MTAAMLVLEPIFEADLPPEQYAYRPGPQAHSLTTRPLQPNLINEGAVWITIQVVREVGVNDFRVAAKQLRFHLDGCVLALMRIRLAS